MARRPCLSVDQVVAALDDTIEECDGYGEAAEYEFDADEPMMEGSDEEFGEFDDELRDQIEVDEMEDETVVDECVVHVNIDEDGGNLGLVEGSEDMVEEEGEVEQEERSRALPTEWSEELTPVYIPPFSSPFGPTLPIPDAALAIFDLYFTPEILQEIVLESNRYASQVLGESFNRYRQLKVDELRAYFGFCMLMAVNRLPAVEDYWKRDPVYTGKQGDTVERGLPARVVKSLTEELKGQNYHVYFDNFFNSFELLNDLASDNIFACGTARSNRRGFPEALKKKTFPNR